MVNGDAEYFARRARTERELACKCEDSSARCAHQEMAERYAAKLITRARTGRPDERA